VQAVRGINLGIRRSEALALIGESGSGKTTIGLGIVRLLVSTAKITSGEMIFRRFDQAGQVEKEFDVLKLSPNEMRAFRWKDCAMVFQAALNAFNPVLKISAQFGDTARAHGYLQGEALRKRAYELFGLVRLDPERVWNAYPHELSGGQIQRVSVARALIPRPRVILADEPVSMVDASLRMEIVNLFRKLRDEQKVSVIYITHDLATAYYISDRISIMLRGYVVESGPVEDVLERPLHPYSQLLKESVPEPEPKEKEAWTRQITLGATEAKEFGRVGCKFAGRCPHVMDMCRQVDPPDVQVETRTVKCYLYTDKSSQNVNQPAASIA
jgi:peptide/nickel transport system ATP-binding protein